MKIEVRMAIMSHLSDAQELMAMGMHDAARQQIKFAKLMLIRYHNIGQEVPEDELDALWAEKMG